MDYPRHHSIADLLRDCAPDEPVYCIEPARYQAAAASFVSGFPGRVLYAVKVNDDPMVLQSLAQGGIRHFDCASLPEIATVHAVCPQATCYFMIPVWLPGAPRRAFKEYGVRHFVVDHADGLRALAEEVPLSDCVVFVRMAVHHASALNDLSVKFGADQAQTIALLQAVAATGAEPALAFNVGSAVTDPDAYRHAMDCARQVLEALPFSIRLLDIGGGYPFPYPGFEVPELARYWATVRDNMSSLPLAADGELLTEPGRSLAAPGLTAVVRVLQRRDNTLYLNDGAYGIFWELRYKGHERYPVVVYRAGDVLSGTNQSFTLFGPTCDALDRLPGAWPLPQNIAAGDYLAVSHIGAYSLSGRTRFNGHYSEHLVCLDGPS